MFTCPRRVRVWPVTEYVCHLRDVYVADVESSGGRLLSDGGAGGLEDDPSTDCHGMVGEPFVVPA